MFHGNKHETDWIGSNVMCHSRKHPALQLHHPVMTQGKALMGASSTLNRAREVNTTCIQINGQL